MKIGITIDNYKLSKYETELKKGGFLFSSRDYIKDCSLISVITDDQQGLTNLITKVETYFLNRRTKNN